MQPIKLDVSIAPSGDLHRDAEQIKHAERLGFDTVWVTESAHNPFLPLTLSAKQTKEIRLGTQAAVAFPRSPMVTAQIAWDLARQSDGRFVLGLGASDRAQIEGRFSEDWFDPIGRMREYIASLRAIWDTFQTDARLRFRGEHYTFRLMAPFFNPGPISRPTVPIYLAGDRPELCRLAGEICQGLHAHAFHTPTHLKEVVMPAFEAGLDEAGRARVDFVMAAPVYIVSGETEVDRNRAAESVRKRLAFYASERAHRRLMSLHGFEELADELSEMAREEQWSNMKDVITDDILRVFAVVAEPNEVFIQLANRYGGIADRVILIWNSDNSQLLKTIADSRGLK